MVKTPRIVIPDSNLGILYDGPLEETFTIQAGTNNLAEFSISSDKVSNTMDEWGNMKVSIYLEQTQ